MQWYAHVFLTWVLHSDAKAWLWAIDFQRKFQIKQENCMLVPLLRCLKNVKDSAQQQRQ